MTLSISNKGCRDNQVSIAEAIALFIIYHRLDIEKATKELINKGYITPYFDGKANIKEWVLTPEGSNKLEAVIVDSDKKQESSIRLNNLASKLKEIFPKGKKSGTNYYWTDGTALIIRRLKTFFKKYANTFPWLFELEYQTLTTQEFDDFIDDTIIKATQNYVASFNGVYTYMKLLKYFIFKEKVGAGGDIEGESDLITFMENSSQECEINRDWTTQLK